MAIVGFKQHDAGIKHFKKAMEIEPEIKLTKSLVTPQLQDAFEEAALTGDTSSGGAAGGPPKAEGTEGAAEGGEEKPSVQADDGADEDRPSAPPRRKAPPPRKKAGDEEEEGDGQTGSLFFALTGGTGFGMASGKGELNPEHKLGGAGFALAQLAHIEPEIGYFLNKDLLLSVALRLQFVNNLNGQQGQGAAPTTSARPATRPSPCWRGRPGCSGTGRSTGRWAAKSAAATSGTPWSSPTTRRAARPAAGPFNQTCVDTLAGGAFLVGPMVGFWYEIGSSLDLILNVNTALGVPKFTFNIDVNAGIGLRI